MRLCKSTAVAGTCLRVADRRSETTILREDQYVEFGARAAGNIGWLASPVMLCAEIPDKSACLLQ
jgi:hypothetical protein